MSGVARMTERVETWYHDRVGCGHSVKHQKNVHGRDLSDSRL
jgi:hypothetical protein